MTAPVYALNLFNVADRDEYLAYSRRSAKEVQAHGGRVLNTLVESSASLCEAYDSTIWQPDGERLLLLAHHGPISVESLPLSRGTVAGRTFLDGRTIHIADLQSEVEEYPESSENARRWSFHAILCVPLMREGVVIGVIGLRRTEHQLFTERQVALLQTFADQVVIAIENVRLFNSVEARTRELSESLEQQTATSEVLQVISSSRGELEPVFEAMLQNAVRICSAKFGHLWLREGDALRAVALHGAPEAYVAERRKNPIAFFGRSALGQKRTLTVLFDHLVGDLLEMQRYVDA